MQCAMTGRPLRDYSEGIYDDGEWISWDWINGQIADQELQSEFPKANVEVVKIFQDLVSIAEAYKQETGRYLQIWGELGELYAEIAYGLARHRPGTQGSDGRIGNDWIEVKTISPEKHGATIQVKRATSTSSWSSGSMRNSNSRPRCMTGIFWAEAKGDSQSSM